MVFYQKANLVESILQIHTTKFIIKVSDDSPHGGGLLCTSAPTATDARAEVAAPCGDD
jgi:hypothetical protein